jgi:hypothetical protein
MKTADAKTTSTIKHLSSDHINTIALSLSEDVYGANGDLHDVEITSRLIDHIHAATDYAYTDSERIPVWIAADLIQSVWEYMDRRYMELQAEALNNGFVPPPLPDVPD